MTKVIIFSCLISTSCLCTAQVGIGEGKVSSSAILQLQGVMEAQELILPRISNVATALDAPKEGMVVYDEGSDFVRFHEGKFGRSSWNSKGYLNVRGFPAGVQNRLQEGKPKGGTVKILQKNSEQCADLRKTNALQPLNHQVDLEVKQKGSIVTVDMYPQISGNIIKLMLKITRPDNTEEIVNPLTTINHVYSINDECSGCGEERLTYHVSYSFNTAQIGLYSFELYSYCDFTSFGAYKDNNEYNSHYYADSWIRATETYLDSN